jgi:predicted DNA-binding transcriptional regulator AlpA
MLYRCGLFLDSSNGGIHVDNLPDILNRDQACEVLGVSRTTLWRLAKDEKLTPIPQRYRRKAPLRFHQADVLRLRDEGITRRYYR